MKKFSQLTDLQKAAIAVLVATILLLIVGQLTTEVDYVNKMID